ncbi:TetR/AcrR family transcriptional regulator [Streptomyces sp. A7024]|uniref:TetR/AcrR family transcriptional regulator n=1 Tax=Streptomyces coryli TaxID=1128680 RepID=A0A6G4UBS0_9ACTN|nr:TetR/AcrR family transcriptional regulator [Streptomyces coryli]NGN69669.1 TetR/AcrR family transcriptional regulator [Streptomyces coryli]
MAEEGLRERKKRQTRQYISDVATGLFVERGFNAVTIAEIAEAANVSVNTVYNYFPAKEDLFFDRSRGVVDRLSRWVRGRGPGESAAEAVLRELREEVESVSPKVGLTEGMGKFMVVVAGADSLKARLWHIQQEGMDNLTDTLREEADAAADDPMPGLIAGQISFVHGTVFETIRHKMIAGGKPNEVSRQTLVIIDELEGLLSEKVLNYARRSAK